MAAADTTVGTTGVEQLLPVNNPAGQIHALVVPSTVPHTPWSSQPEGQSDQGVVKETCCMKPLLATVVSETQIHTHTYTLTKKNTHKHKHKQKHRQLVNTSMVHKMY